MREKIRKMFVAESEGIYQNAKEYPFAVSHNKLLRIYDFVDVADS